MFRCAELRNSCIVVKRSIYLSKTLVRGLAVECTLMHLTCELYRATEEDSRRSNSARQHYLHWPWIHSLQKLIIPLKHNSCTMPIRTRSSHPRSVVARSNRNNRRSSEQNITVKLLMMQRSREAVHLFCLRNWLSYISRNSCLNLFPESLQRKIAESIGLIYLQHGWNLTVNMV